VLDFLVARHAKAVPAVLDAPQRLLNELQGAAVLVALMKRNSLV